MCYLMRSYYLCPLTGSGSASDPFRPVVASVGSFGMLDLRPDETRVEGWCFACIDSTEASAPLNEDVLHLGDDPSLNLSEEIVLGLRQRLGVDIQSRNLADIAAEILLMQLLPGHGLRPTLEGRYQIYLCGLLWEATESEVYEFIGQLREPELIGGRSSRPRGQVKDLRPALSDALERIAALVRRGAAGWLEAEIQKVEEERSRQPLATNYIAARALLEEQDPSRIDESHAAIWILMLARDLDVSASRVDFKNFAPRLRDANDCEPTKYELYVMASYIEQGMRVEVTDRGRLGEFRILEPEGAVYVECKYKTRASMDPRGVKEVFDEANRRLRQLLDEKDMGAFIEVTCRTDPSEEDLPKLTACVSRGLDMLREGSAQVDCGGKFSLVLWPGDLIRDGEGVNLSAGFDYGFVESVLDDASTGQPTAQHAVGVGWRVLRPGGWRRSTVDSVRRAAQQLPKDNPGLVYVHVPPGGIGAVVTRMEDVAPEIEHLLANQERHTRVNAVVLTGQASIKGWSAPGVATERFTYLPIANQHPRNELPSGFGVFGRDFRRQ